MQTHVINVQLRVTTRPTISAGDLLRDLRAQLSAIQEPAPYRSTDGPGWWTNSRDAVDITFENVGDSLAAELEGTSCASPGCLKDVHVIGTDNGRPFWVHVENGFRECERGGTAVATPR